MDYFSVYDLPVSFSPDPNLVRTKYFELSKRYHPDFYINDSQEKQLEVLELSTLNNKAYDVLRDPQKRLQYILELKSLIYEGESYTLPQAFLMEMMDINEALMELQFDGDAAVLGRVKENVADIGGSLDDELRRYTEEFDSTADEDRKAALLLLIKDIYYRKKYLKRIGESILKLERE